MTMPTLSSTAIQDVKATWRLMQATGGQCVSKRCLYYYN